MARCKVGVQLWPEHTDIGPLREAWQAADELGVDSLWVWDHFFPLTSEADGRHFEGWSLLAAMAVETARATVGTLVTSMGYRNPDLLADMARTIDHLSGGRAVLGVGAGWFERDYDEYGYEFGDGPARLRHLQVGLERIRLRLGELDPPPLGRLPILVGGGGERVTLRIVAEQADAWNSFGPPDQWAHRNRVLDDWCEQVSRDPATIERTVAINDPAEAEADLEAYLAAGATHVIVGIGQPFDLAPVRRLLDRARG